MSDDELACPDPTLDHLDWRSHPSVVECLRAEGDDTLLFTAWGCYWADDEEMADPSAFESVALVMTNDGVYLFCRDGERVVRKIGCDCVLELATYEDAEGLLRVETDEGDVLLAFDGGRAQQASFADVFCEEILPLPVEEHESLAPHAAERRLPAAVCGALGLCEQRVADHAVEDEVERLEREREERIVAEREAEAEAGRLAAEARDALRRQKEQDRHAAEEAHSRGMRRLSMRRRTCAMIGLEVKRWQLSEAAEREEQPVWWEGAFCAEDPGDPFLMEEERVDAMAEKIKEEKAREAEEKMRKVMAVVRQLEREEANLRRVIEGETRLHLSDIRELVEQDRARLRKSIQEWQNMMTSLIARLEKEEIPVRAKLEADEDSERRRLHWTRDAGTSRLDDVSKLMRSTAHDECRIRQEILRVEETRFADLCARLRKEASRRRRSVKAPPTLPAAAVVAATGSAPDAALEELAAPAALEELNLATRLKERKESVRRRHLNVTRLATTRRRAGSSRPTSPNSPTRSDFSGCYDLSEDGDGASQLLSATYRSVDFSYGEAGSAAGTPCSASVATPRTPFPRGAFGEPALVVTEAESVGSNSPPPTPTPAVAAAAAPRAARVGGGGGGGGGGDFRAAHLALLEGWQNDVRRNLGLGADAAAPSGRAASAAAVAVLAAAAAAAGGTPGDRLLQHLSRRSSSPQQQRPPLDTNVVDSALGPDGSIVEEWRCGVVTVQPQWSQSVVYTYRPVAAAAAAGAAPGASTSALSGAGAAGGGGGSLARGGNGYGGGGGGSRQTFASGSRERERTAAAGFSAESLAASYASVSPARGGTRAAAAAAAAAARAVPSSPPPAYPATWGGGSRRQASVASSHHRHPSPLRSARNPSPLRGGGTLAGGMLCHPVRRYT